MVNSVVMGYAPEDLDGLSFRGSAIALDPESCATMSRFSGAQLRTIVRADARPGMTASPSLLRLAGILHRLEGREFDVVEFAVDLLDLADVDVLDDVAGFWIDRDRAARAFPLHALHRRDQFVAVGLAAGLLQRLVDQMDAVIAAHRHEARTGAERLLVGGDKLLVHRRRMRRGIQMRGDGAERR